MKRGQIERGDTSGRTPAHFGLRLRVQVPEGATRNLTAIVKPAVDGVIAALHSHDGSACTQVSERVAETLDVPAADVRALLLDQRSAILGRRRLLWPWSSGVQWNPADDALVAAELLWEPDSSARHWELSGEVFEVSPAA